MSAYAKLQVLNGPDFYICQLPFTIGSSSSSHLSINCKKVQSNHCSIFWANNHFQLKAKAPTMLVQSGTLTDEDPAVDLKDLSCISIPCDIHPSHIFYFILPVFTASVLEPPGMAPIPDNEEMMPIDSFPSRQADSSLIKKWGINDRENLKKWLLTYGYGRWKKLQEAMSEGGAFSLKSIPEIRSFATSLVRTIVENLPMEKHELKKSLSNMIEETEDDFYIPPRIKDWGMMVRQRAVPWGKRLYML